jgi:hypothetical protein
MARPPERAQKSCAFLLTWTYIKVRYPDLVSSNCLFNAEQDSSSKMRSGKEHPRIGPNWTFCMETQSRFAISTPLTACQMAYPLVKEEES